MLAGVKVRLWLFLMRLSHSGRGFVHAFSHQAQEAFFTGHRLAFEHFGGVPRRALAVLEQAVVRILVGRDRVESERLMRRGLVTGPARSSVSLGSRARTRKAAWRARSAALRRAYLVPVPMPRTWPSSMQRW